MKNPRWVLAFLIAASVLPTLVRAQEKLASFPRLLDHLFIVRDNTTARVSSFEKEGANIDWVTIAPGETKLLADISGAGVIRRFYMAPFAFDRMRYRKLILRIYWDGRKEPCVEVPIGDFFGSGLGTLRYFHSAVIDVNYGFREWDFDGMVSYFPMPFEKGARITVQNDGGVEEFRLWYQFDYELYDEGELPANAGKFHAQWRRVARTPVREGIPKNSTLGNAQAKNTEPKNNYVILDAEGRGTYVGFFLTIDNLAGGWYGEGDDMIFVDGATWPPTYPGTGTEEIFNGGCCPSAEYAGLYTGYYLIENYKGNWGGKNQMYRFLIHDPVRFQKSVLVTLEHGHDNNFENDYTTTAFWYQVDPHKPFPPLPSAQDRMPAWPDGVAEALELEAQLQLELYRVAQSPTVQFSPDDGAQLQKLTQARNKAFRELRYDDFISNVREMEAIAKRYRGSSVQ